MSSAAATTTAALSACRDVSVRYGSGESEVTALDHVNVEIEAGETLALRVPPARARRRCSTCSAASWSRPPAR